MKNSENKYIRKLFIFFITRKKNRKNKKYNLKKKNNIIQINLIQSLFKSKKVIPRFDR